MFREVTPVGHSNLNTDRTDYREWCWKTVPRRVVSRRLALDLPARSLNIEVQPISPVGPSAPSSLPETNDVLKC